MFEPRGDCDGDVVPQPLTWDSLVLVCDEHLPDLRALRRDIAELRRVMRYLHRRFEVAA
jgi:hypothetical protein